MKINIELETYLVISMSIAFGLWSLTILIDMILSIWKHILKKRFERLNKKK